VKSDGPLNASTRTGYNAIVYYVVIQIRIQKSENIQVKLVYTFCTLSGNT